MIYIFIVALFLLLISSGVDVTVSPNVGTVLFTKQDVFNEWPKSKMALLRARLYAQHLMPPFAPPQAPDFVDTLLKYFKNCYTTIRQESRDAETDHILTTAFTDVVGGYMKAFALPVTKYGYYGGSLPQQDVLKLFMFYEDVKNYLGRKDSGWASPDLARLNAMTTISWPPFSFHRRSSIQHPCQHLAYFQKSPSGLVIPTPIIDWNSRMMFVPLANETLINLNSANASDALHKYYDVALNCVRLERPSQLDSFHDRFQTWLQGEVVPHLNDDPLYAALRGVLSLVNASTNLAAYSAYQHAMYPKSEKAVQETTYFPAISTKMLIILIIVALEIIWCIPALLCMCRRRKQRTNRDSCIETILDTKDNGNSDSECYYENTSEETFHKRRGGLRLQMRPNTSMEVGTVFSSHTMCSASTETRGQWAGRRPDVATMVDEELRKRSSKDTQTKANKRNVSRVSKQSVNKNSWTQPTSDGTSKTAIQSVPEPSQKDTIRPSHDLEKSADASVESGVDCVKEDRQSPCLPCLFKETDKPSMKVSPSLYSVCTVSADTVVTQECPNNDQSDAQNAATDGIKVVKPEKRSYRGPKSPKLHVMKPKKCQFEKRLLEIRIDKPCQEISLDVTQGDLRKEKKSKIPKRAAGYVEMSQWKPRVTTTPASPKSLIPKLKWAEDSFLARRSTKPEKLNVTL